MGQGRNDLRGKVTGKAGELAEKAEAKAGDIGLTRQRATEVRHQALARGQQAVESSVDSARQVAAGARRNKPQVAVVAAVAIVIAAVLAAWRIVSRRKST